MKKVFAAITMTVLSYLLGAYNVSGRNVESQLNEPVIPTHVKKLRGYIGEYKLEGASDIVIFYRLHERLIEMGYGYPQKITREIYEGQLEKILRTLDKNGDHVITTDECNEH